MSFSSASGTTTTTDEGGYIYTDIIESHILTRLDGPTLASASCANTQFNSICSENNLWRNICNTTWPSTTDSRVSDVISSFPSGHRSFYYDSFPSLRHHIDVEVPQNKSIHPRVSNTSEFISAVDIYYDDVLIHSKVIETETLSCWFLTSPFQIDLLGHKEGHKETIATPIKFKMEGNCVEERLRVSWILIDKVRKRAVNFASLKPVDVRIQGITEEDIQIRYATVVATKGGDLVQCGVVVSCGGIEGGVLNLKEVNMQVEDMDGRILIGIDSLGILNDAMEGERRRSNQILEKFVYEKFSRNGVEKMEKILITKEERRLDIVFIGIGVSIFFAVWGYFNQVP